MAAGGHFKDTTRDDTTAAAWKDFTTESTEGMSLLNRGGAETQIEERGEERGRS